MLVSLAWRNIGRALKRSLLVGGAAAFGMFSILGAFGLINGLKNMFYEGTIQAGLGHIQIHPQGFRETHAGGMFLKNAEHIREDIAQGKQDFHLSPRFEREGLLRMDRRQRGVLIMGVDPESEKAISRFDDWLQPGGEYLKAAASTDLKLGIIPCLLGQVNAQYFEIGVGDTLVLSMGDKTGNSVSFRCRAVGFFRSLAESIDKYTVIVNREDLSHFFGSEQALASYIVLVASDIAQTPLLKRSLGAKVTAAQAELLSYDELQPGIYRMLEIIDFLLSVVSVILMIGFGLILLNSVLMSIFERTREFGILRAIGTSGGFLFLLILCEATILAFVGCLAGALLGSLVVGGLHVWGINFEIFAQGLEKIGGMGTTIYPELTLRDIAFSFSIGMTISILSVLYPAIKVTRIVPLEAMHAKN